MLKKQIILAYIKYKTDLCSIIIKNDIDMNTFKSKAKCPKCGYTNLILMEISIASTTFVQSVGYVAKDSSYNEVGNIIRLEGKCNRCNHGWIFRNAIQITDVLEHPEKF